MAQVLAELQIANPSRANPTSLNDADVRALAGVPSGSISMSNLYGKSAFITLTGANIDSTSKSGSKPTNTTITLTSTATPVPSNATNVTYAWQFVSGTNMIASGANTATVTYSGNRSTAGSINGVFNCKITQGSTSYTTPNVTITMTWTP
jgi:hypothetical protein